MIAGFGMCERDLIRDRLLDEVAPVVLSGFLSTWKASSLTPETLAGVFPEHSLKFRIGKQSTEVQWENQCQYASASISEFNEWVNGDSRNSSSLSCFNCDTHWCYADYKRMAEIFKDQPGFLKDVDWSVLGFESYGGEQSTFWLGSRGSNTVCHYDTYGCNLVAQLYGRKRWVMFPPSDTPYMYPTRIPYEESSVFSQVSVKSPDLNKFPEFQKVTPYVVTLEPGDVLFVPSKWWHFVESLETSISVNCWVDLPKDDAERVREAVTRTMIFSLMSENEDPVDSWLNPTEDITSGSCNLEYVQLALSALAKSESLRPTDSSCDRKRNRENSPNGDLEEPRRKIATKEERPCISHSSSSVNVPKQYNSTTVQQGTRVQKVVATSWNEFCQTMGIDSTTEVERADQSARNSSKENDSKMGFELRTPNASSDLHSYVCSASDRMFSVGDVATSKVTCPSDILNHQITAFDLADVFLHPEVVDLIFKKLLKKFNISSSS